MEPTTDTNDKNTLSNLFYSYNRNNNQNLVQTDNNTNEQEKPLIDNTHEEVHEEQHHEEEHKEEHNEKDDKLKTSIKEIIENISNVTEEVILKLNDIKEPIEELANDFIKLLNDNLTKEDIAIKLTSIEVNVMNILLKSNPNMFNEINNVINKLKIEKLNLTDITDILILLKHLIEIIHNINTNNNIKINKTEIPTMATSILKFTINTILQDAEQNNSMADVNKLIDTSIELVNLFGTLRTPQCKINWKNIFSCNK